MDRTFLLFNLFHARLKLPSEKIKQDENNLNTGLEEDHRGSNFLVGVYK
jgi:hypothetical protein